MPYYKLRIALISSVFLILLFFPMINKKFGLINDSRSYENRSLAHEPNFKEIPLDSFPKFYDKYYSDSFPLRSKIIKSFNYLVFFVLHKLPSSDFVILGKHDWLFLAGEEFEAYTGVNNFTAKQLADYKEELEYRKKFLEERKCKFYFMVTPAKPVIYPENISYTQPRVTYKSLGEELLAYLEKNSSVNVVDLYQVLRINKKNYPTYYAIDNHWTRPGAFYSANQFLSQLQKDFPEISRLSLDDYIISKNDTTEGNTAKILGTPALFHDTSYRLSLKKKSVSSSGSKYGYLPDKKFPYPYEYELVKVIKDSKAPRLLIISDSFGTDIFPLLSEKFSKTIKIWDNWEYKLNEKIVENEKPDVVLLLIHEKNLRSFMKHRSGPGKNKPF